MLETKSFTGIRKLMESGNYLRALAPELLTKMQNLQADIDKKEEEAKKKT